MEPLGDGGCTPPEAGRCTVLFADKIILVAAPQAARFQHVAMGRAPAESLQRLAAFSWRNDRRIGVGMVCRSTGRPNVASATISELCRQPNEWPPAVAKKVHVERMNCAAIHPIERRSVGEHAVEPP
jgi:hypothetical protein